MLFCIVFKLKQKCYDERLEDWNVLDIEDMEQDEKNSIIFLKKTPGYF